MKEEPRTVTNTEKTETVEVPIAGAVETTESTGVETTGNVEASETVESTEPPPSETPTDGSGSKKKTDYRFNKRMLIIDTALKNAEKPGTFHDSIALYGLDDARLLEGRTLFDTTRTARTDQLNARALKINKTRELTGLISDAKKQYRSHRVLGIEEFS